MKSRTEEVSIVLSRSRSCEIIATVRFCNRSLLSCDMGSSKQFGGVHIMKSRIRIAMIDTFV